MSTGRTLQVGDYALTDYNGKGMTRVTITARKENADTGSRIAFQVSPRLRNGGLSTWYDADWFEQEPQPAAKDK